MSSSASWPMSRNSRRNPSARFRSTARSSSTPRCCRCIAARRRSTGRSSKAAARPALPSSAPPTGSMKGRCCCRRRSTIGPDDTLGSVYFDRIFPLGVKALLEAADARGRRHAHARSCRTRSQATYEGWVPRRRIADQLGAATPTRSTTSSAAAIPRPAPGQMWARRSSSSSKRRRSPCMSSPR